ncbi:MAG: hypothetical protein AAAC48_22605 [Phyllobacterium sp.]|jgi:hypothetical protein|uniref:hypothetical protein n=1 Tax=Phyllobacterium sp. TaxID=1871046 RepID=UPI0030F07ED1
MLGFASSSTGIHEFNSFLAASHDTDAGVYVSFDGDTSGILIEGIALADLSMVTLCSHDKSKTQGRK